jgi:GTPase SAR1 family protein
MLVGHGEAGKTALMQRLIYDTFDDKAGTTDGISMQMWEHARVRFDVWVSENTRTPIHSSTA